MLAELVFVTRLLGLVSSTHELDVQADRSVRSVEILLDGRRVDILRGDWWKTTIDLGRELAPHELVAVARDEKGRELARDRQFLNVPRPQAEIGVLFQRDRADITWQHISGQPPKKMRVKLGDKTLSSKVTGSVKLPPLSPSSINVLTVDLTFDDGTTAHREVVFGGLFAEEVPAELTPTIVRERAEGEKNRGDCFRHQSRTIEASAIEDPEAMLIVVRHPDPPAAQYRKQNYKIFAEGRFGMPRTSMRFMWPVARSAGVETELFMSSTARPVTAGLRARLLSTIGPKVSSVRLADAVAVAGTEALREPRRRAVLLILNGEEDRSRYRPAVVRHYLQRLGVPLYVWSLKGPVADSEWGEVQDASKHERLLEAIEKMQKDLTQQRVAWLPLNPYEALHVETKPDCAWEPLALRQ
jgi:hypothetical protein